jgi:hypothetical protein
MKKPFETWILLLLLLLLAINAFYGGISMMLAPDGSMLGMQPSWLDKSPFNNYLVPGILLLLMNGIFPLLALFGLFTKNRIRFGWLNIYKDKYWGWTFSLYTGIICIVWIIVQQLLTAYFILQPIIAGVGLFIVVFTLMPRIQKYYSI